MAFASVLTCAALLAPASGVEQNEEQAPVLAHPARIEPEAPRRRAARGLDVNDPRLLLGMGVGWYAGLYGFSSLGSVLVLDSGTSPAERRAAKANLVPVVGPFVAAGFSSQPRPKAGYAVIGALRVGALAAGTVGAIAYRRDIGRPSASEAWGMVGGGAMVFTVIYAMSAGFAGGRLREDSAKRRAVGRRALVPGIGGYLAMPQANSHLGAWGWGTASTLQMVGLSVAAVGAWSLASDRRTRRARPTAAFSETGFDVGVQVRF